MNKPAWLLLVIAILAASVLATCSFAKSVNAVSLVIDEERSFNTGQISSCISINPDVASVRTVSSKTFSIKGQSRGVTYVHVLCDDGSLRTIKVTVNLPVVQNPASELQQSQQHQKSLKFTYSSLMYGGDSTSQYSQNRWAYAGAYYQLGAKGMTPLGETNSYIQYEGYNGQWGISQFSVNYKRDDSYLTIGDSFIGLSDLTFPMTHYQGLYYDRQFSDNFNLTLAGGARGNYLWGKAVRLDTRPEMSFAAARADMRPNNKFDLYLTAVTSSLEGSQQNGQILSAGAEIKPVDGLSVKGELASNAGTQAWLAKTVYSGQQIYFNGTYRHVPASFETPTDSINYRGIEGFFLSGSYRPMPFLFFAADTDSYINSYLQGTGNNIYNKDLKVRAEINISQWTKFSYAPWKQTQYGYTQGGAGEGSVTELSTIFKLLGSDTAYIRYEPSKFAYLNASTNYNNENTLFGIRLELTDKLYMNFENALGTTTYTQAGGTQESADIFRIMLGYDSKLGDSPFYTKFNSHYYTGQENMGVLSVNQNEFWVDGEIGYQPNPDTKVYLRGSTGDFRGSVNNTVDHAEKHIGFGVNLAFDTKATWEGRGTVRGVVFKDVNGNGIYDKGEESISGVKVVVGNMAVMTDTGGNYVVKGVRPAVTDVMLDMDSLKKRYMMTTPNPVSIDVRQGETSLANIGIKAPASISVNVFEDLNGDGKFDGNDIPVGGADVRINGDVYQTASDGTFMIYDAKAGTYTTVIDIRSLTREMLPTVPVQNVVEIKEGDNINIDFPVSVQGRAEVKQSIGQSRNGKHSIGAKGVRGRNKTSSKSKKTTKNILSPTSSPAQ